MKINLGKFIDKLDQAIEFHGSATNNPHQIGNAVIATLTEIKAALHFAREADGEMILTDDQKAAYMRALASQRLACSKIEDCAGSPQQTEISTHASQAAFFLQAICMKFWEELDPVTGKSYLAALKP